MLLLFYAACFFWLALAITTQVVGRQTTAHRHKKVCLAIGRARIWTWICEAGRLVSELFGLFTQTHRVVGVILTYKEQKQMEQHQSQDVRRWAEQVVRNTSTTGPTPSQRLPFESATAEEIAMTTGKKGWPDRYPHEQVVKMRAIVAEGLSKGHKYSHIASSLNAHGLRTTVGKPFTTSNVATLTRTFKMQRFGPCKKRKPNHRETVVHQEPARQAPQSESEIRLSFIQSLLGMNMNPEQKLGMIRMIASTQG